MPAMDGTRMAILPRAAGHGVDGEAKHARERREYDLLE
jgi:hypothetical protein